MSDRQIRQALVTGASGFVGGRLALALLREGVRVRVLVRNAGAARRLADLGASAIIGDLAQPELPPRLLAGADTVFHCAALLGPPSRPVSEFRAVNVEGSRALARAAARNGVERFVHVSSVAVTGGSFGGEPLDDDCPTRPVGPYAVTKLESEKAVREELQGRVPFAIARPAWVYGPDSIGMRRLAALIARRRMPLIGGGVNHTQPVWIGDLISGLLRGGRTTGEGHFHMAGPASMTTRDLLASLARELNAPPPHFHVPMAAALVAAALCERLLPRSLRRLPIDSAKVEFFRVDHVYTNRRAGELLGWAPRKSWVAGIAETCRAWREEGMRP